MDLRRCVVAGVDLSEISPAVVQTAVRLAGKMGRPLLVVHTLGSLSGGEEEGPILPSLRRKVRETKRRSHRDLEHLLEDLGLAKSGSVVPRVVQGEAGSLLAETARSLSASLVVVGASHPGGGLNSCGAKVVRASPAPILVCHRPALSGYRNVLVGVDASPESEEAWGQALRLAEPDASLTACCAADGHGSPLSREALGAWVSARSSGRAAAARVEPGSPREVLTRTAQALSADLLAVGRVSRGALRELLLGSTEQTVAQQAPCDVLVAAGTRDSAMSP